MPALPTIQRPWYILPVIVLAQFAGTSLWFAGNAVLPDLQRSFQLPIHAMGYLTSAVQIGFILGTFLFALLLIADRFSAPAVFLVCALLASLANLSIYYLGQGLWSILSCRLLTGFFLAGIYPVGMKIAADWYPRGLGLALGYLVGALVVGTAFPHLLRHQAADWPWEQVLMATSGVASVGGILLWLLVPNRSLNRKRQKVELTVLPRLFAKRSFRSAAFGYFGHMWELYTFWTFVPFILQRHDLQSGGHTPLSLYSFWIIFAGAIGCVAGGYWSRNYGSARVAFSMLLISGTCCLLCPLFFGLNDELFIIFLLIWGFSVVGDSPQFSSLVARFAPAAFVGSALTIVNCLGFSLTIFSIELFNAGRSYLADPYYVWLLLPGPVLGLISIGGGLFSRRSEPAQNSSA